MISCLEKPKTKNKIQVERFPNNPLLIPDPESSWMSTRVFNCGVIQDEDGLYRMLFRATFQPLDLAASESNLGFAWSADGVEWHVHASPVLRSGFNQYMKRGAEDPRIVRWEDWYYIFTTVFAKKNARIGIWRTKDFFRYEWVGIPFNQATNNAGIFPELIEGNTYLLYRKFPDIWISRTPDFSLQGGWRDHQVVVKRRELYKSIETGIAPRKIGMAAPPIKTPHGWLTFIFTAHGKRFGEVYSIGFVVLDLQDPIKVNYIHPSPILWPEEPYEMRCGKRGICFCCAAVESPDGESFYLYWGAGDKYIAGGRLKKADLRGICY